MKPQELKNHGGDYGKFGFLFCIEGIYKTYFIINVRRKMITLEEIREIHRETIEMDKHDNPDDYAPGELYIAIVELMLIYKMDLTKSVYYNAAVALHTIASQHPFNNGNKRTASATALIISDIPQMSSRK